MPKKTIKTLSLFRDLGDIKTTDGKHLKKGMIFRGSDLSKLSPKDLEVLKSKFNIGIDIDLRTEEELGFKPDLSQDLEYHNIRLVRNEDNPAVVKETRISVLDQIISEEGGMKGHLVRLYRKIVSDPYSLAKIKEFFDIILVNNGDKGIFYHCTQGKDRTGIMTVLLLLALDFDREDIVNDYLSYNKFRRIMTFWIFIGMFFFVSPRRAWHCRHSLVAKKMYINPVFDEIENVWGNAHNFLIKAVGLKEEDITKLKNLYLVENK